MLVGSCHICSAPAMFTCTVCGRLVCIECYNKQSRLCKNCLKKFRRVMPDDGSPYEPARFEEEGGEKDDPDDDMVEL